MKNKHWDVEAGEDFEDRVLLPAYGFFTDPKEAEKEVEKRNKEIGREFDFVELKKAGA